MLPREKTFCAATRPSPVRSGQPLPSRAGFGDGTNPRGCRKLRLARFREGHEFHTLRKRSVSRWFRGRARVPLVPQTPPPQRRLPAAGGTLPREKTFCAATRPSPVRSRQRLPFRAGFGKGTSSTRAANAAPSMAASSRWGLPPCKTLSSACYAAESCPLPAAASVSLGSGKGTSSRRSGKLRLTRVLGRARVPLVPQTPPPQRRLPAAGGMLPCEKTFCAATRPSPVRSRQRLPRVRRAAGAATCAGR